MPILNIVTNVPGMAGVNPRIVYFETDDTLATITTTGYLNNSVEYGLADLSNYDIALVYGTNLGSGGGAGSAFFQIIFSGGNYSLVQQPAMNAVTAVTGTANRVTSSGGYTPVIDIASTYVGQNSITTLGTIGTGTWQGSVIGGTYGGTGVNNGANTLTVSANSTINQDVSSTAAPAFRNAILGYATTATAAGTTTLTASSAYQQYFTGSTTQTVVLPVTSTLALGYSFYIVNNSTGNVTVQSSGANTIKVMAANTVLKVTCINLSVTDATGWNYLYAFQDGVSPDAQIQAAVNMNAAQWNGMSVTPFLMIAAPGANKIIIVHDWFVQAIYGTTQYADGGTVVLEYDNIAAGAGVAASGTISAGTITGIAANSIIRVADATTSGAASAMVNKAIYLSNQTGAFTTGDGTFVVNLWYSIVSTTV